MSHSFEATKRGYANLWDQAKVTSSSNAKAAAQRILAARDQLQPVEDATDVPWYLVGCWLYRESNLNFGTILANGQSLKRVTTIVPKGLGPFSSFLEGAVASIQYEHKVRGGKDFYKVGKATWVLEYQLWASEEWNGEGYYSHNVDSPYVWAWTSLYTRGKFDSDGHFNSGLVDPQGGIAAILMALFEIEPSLMPARITGESPMSTTATATAAPAPAGININTLEEITKGLETVVSFLPTVAMFFPPLQVAVPFVPLIEGLLKMAEELESAPHDPNAIAGIIISHLEQIKTNLGALNIPPLKPAGS